MCISVVIPARNEKYLGRTIRDILVKSTETEIIVILEGYWADDLVLDDRVTYIHHTIPKGMRRSINEGVALAKGDYILKTDAHCMFAQDFDKELLKNIENNWIVVPRRYALDPEKWKIEKRSDDKYPVDYEYIDKDDLHGVEWREKRNTNKDIMIDEIISAQGSCWFTSKKHFEFIEGLDEINFGTFFLEFQELSFKTWLSGGKVMINKNTWYAHLHKTNGRGYSLNSGEREKAVEFIKYWKNNNKWNKQKTTFESLLNKFLPMPGW